MTPNTYYFYKKKLCFTWERTLKATEILKTSNFPITLYNNVIYATTDSFLY